MSRTNRLTQRVGAGNRLVSKLSSMHLVGDDTQARRTRRSLVGWALWVLLSGAGSAVAQNTMYYAATDGTVRGFNIVTRAETARIPPTRFVGAIVGAAREIAYDPATRLMWYSATDNTIRSLHIGTLAAGPMIPSNRIPGAIIGAARHVFIDYTGRRLLVPITSGEVQMYHLSNQSSAGRIPSTAFTDGNVGAFRHLASDVRTGNVWSAATDGSFREISLRTMTATGRVVRYGSIQRGGNPGAFRHFVIDAARGLLLYAVTDGSVASINLTNLSAANFKIPSTAFAGAIVGAGRIITSDGSYLPAVQFGRGCAGSAGTPVLAAAPNSGARLGQTLALQLRNLPTGNTTFLILGFSRTNWAGLPLPLPLNSFGAPGCNLLVSMDLYFQIPNVGGTANWSLLLPQLVGLVGLPLYTQGFVVDPPANSLRLVFSNGTASVIGVR